MSSTIKVTEGECSHIDDVLIKPPRMHGFLMFSRFNDSCPWTMCMPFYQIGTTPPVSCPSPLFQTRAAAISHAQESNTIATEIKIFEVKE